MKNYRKLPRKTRFFLMPYSMNDEEGLLLTKNDDIIKKSIATHLQH